MPTNTKNVFIISYLKYSIKSSFSPTSNGDSCKYCPYTKLCGKNV